jgi:hypothetical protein
MNDNYRVKRFKIIFRDPDDTPETMNVVNTALNKIIKYMKNLDTFEILYTLSLPKEGYVVMYLQFSKRSP